MAEWAPFRKELFIRLIAPSLTSICNYAPNFGNMGKILVSACPSVRPCVRPSVIKNETRILKFHIRVPYKK